MRCKSCLNESWCLDDNEPYCQDVLDDYSKYLINWYNTHKEGNPVCIEEWFNNEYMEDEYND